MGKNKFVYVCRECGYDTVKWFGQCPGCGAWNSLEEELITKKTSFSGSERVGLSGKPQPITLIQGKENDRFSLDGGELDGVLGGGIVPGSLVLVGGEPGIGKSTLLMQVAFNVGTNYGKTLYVSGEESAHQVRLRAERLNALSQEVLLLTETNLHQIIGYAEAIKPALLVIDSIQTVFLPEMSSAPGSVSQVRQCTAELMRFAKQNNIAVVLVGHVTKEGTLAGPRVLEHIVDTVLYFEGERHHSFRILRAVKNRFGSTNEIAVFDMQNRGLVPFTNPSQLFLGQRPQGVSGSVVASAMQGTRPILLEVQALASTTPYGNPRRLASGVDFNRVLIIIAVLEKVVGMHVSGQDIYINIAGGIKVDDPGTDLAVAAAVASSFRNIEVDGKTVIIGEVGLGGEVRAVANLERRLKEAKKLGFTRAIVPKTNVQSSISANISAIPVENLAEALDILIGR
ncbi:MAG: DNA repair protein RadA [Desulfitobacteriaceae bacterium]|nr:DNA repair protein RadA [Desulfitobacteriaceae bacterium]